MCISQFDYLKIKSGKEFRRRIFFLLYIQKVLLHLSKNISFILEHTYNKINLLDNLTEQINKFSYYFLLTLELFNRILIFNRKYIIKLPYIEISELISKVSLLILHVKIYYQLTTFIYKNNLQIEQSCLLISKTIIVRKVWCIKYMHKHVK